MKDLRILDAEGVRRALPMADAIEAMREAFTLLARGTAHLPQRSAITGTAGCTLLVMPGSVPGTFGLGAKLVAVTPDNERAGRPVVQGVLVLFDPRTGSPAAVLDGAALTAIRTGAASGLATDLLAPRDASRLAILGSGAQARTQLEAVCTVRRIEVVRVWSRTRAHAERFAAGMRGAGPIPATIQVARTAADAVRNVHVVCTATSASTPVLHAAEVPDGAHVNAVGAFTPQMTEVDPDLLGDALVVVDQCEAALAEAGEVIAAVKRGAIRSEELIELGSLLDDAVSHRQPSHRVTLFKSVGLAVQDLVAGARLLAGGADGAPPGDPRTTRSPRARVP